MTDLDAEARAIEQAESTAQRENRRLRGEVDTLTRDLEELRRVVDFYGAANAAPVEIPEWQVRPSGGGHAGLVVAHTTDWHLEEVVKPEEIFYLNAYNREIALLRIRKWAEKVVTLPRDYVRGIDIEGLVIPSTGDLFTGIIHDELRETNDAPLLDSFVFWQEPILAALELLGREYPAVAVHAVVGNHGRLSHKPIYKGRVYDNVEWAFWSVIRSRLRDRGSAVTVNVSPSMDLNVPIYGRNHLLTHGDQFRGGTGISGAFAPLSLGSHRKNRRQMRAGMPMETMVIGHMHQLINIPGVIMGGCLKGYDEYAFGLNLDPDPNGAAQAMWITTPERAQSVWMPVYVQDREAEGW